MIEILRVDLGRKKKLSCADFFSFKYCHIRKEKKRAPKRTKPLYLEREPKAINIAEKMRYEGIEF